MSVQLSKRNLLIGLYTIGALLLVVSGVLSWDRYVTDPERVFWGTIDQGMKTSGVTVQANQSGNGSSMHQTTQYAMNGQSAAHTTTSLTQGGTVILNEIISTQTADYTRYDSIKTDQKTPSGKPMHFSKVIGVWAKIDGGSGQSELLPQAVLGTNLPLGGVALPLAPLSPANRTALANQIKKDKVYAVDFKHVTKAHKNGRLVYTYTAKVNPGTYAAMMKKFGTMAGIHTLDSINPEQYAGQPSFTLKLTVDARSHRLVTAESEDGSVRQTYTGYDIPVLIKAPATALSSTELQKRLQEAQQ